MKYCKACHQWKEIDEFWNNCGAKDGKEYRCKSCKKSGRMISRPPRKETPIKKNNGGIHDFYSMGGVTKGDYMEMYRVLSLLGYDVTQSKKTIHEQFVDKLNKEKNLNLPYRKRTKKEISRFLFDGSINPEYLQNKKKN